MTDFITGLSVNVQKPYPSAQIPTKNEQMANLLLSAFAGGGNAELSAATQYINHSQTIENKAVSNLLPYVALIEMYHIQILARMIVSLGGSLKYWNTDDAYWSGSNVEYGGSLCEKLSLDIFSEQEAISGYEALVREINTAKAPGMEAVAAVIQRVLEDKCYHLTLFKEAYTESGDVFLSHTVAGRRRFIAGGRPDVRETDLVHDALGLVLADLYPRGFGLVFFLFFFHVSSPFSQ